MSAALKPRLLPVLIGATLCLLTLKLIGLATQGGYLFSHERQAFGRILTEARTIPPWAMNDITGANPGKKAESDAAPAKAAEPASQPLPASPPSAAEREILERLAERRRQLEDKARELDLREQLLRSAEKLTQDRLDDLKRSEVRQDGETAKIAPELKALAGMYEAMKPREAARVFEKMDALRLLPLARQMNPRKLAEILAAMTPETAERLTALMLPRPAPTPRPAALPQMEELPRLPYAPTG